MEHEIITAFAIAIGLVILTDHWRQARKERDQEERK